VKRALGGAQTIRRASGKHQTRFDRVHRIQAVSTAGDSCSVPPGHHESVAPRQKRGGRANGIEGKRTRVEGGGVLCDHFAEPT
jgi:hypothetical protein